MESYEENRVKWLIDKPCLFLVRSRRSLRRAGGLMDIKNPVAEARNEYTYSASGQKLKVVQKWNPNYSSTPVAGVGSAINTDSLTQSKKTEYIGNMIYENDALKRILIDGGYIEGGVYNYFMTDQQGNNGGVYANGMVIQSLYYYPLGMAFAETSIAVQGKQPYKYNGKELDMMSGLNQYDYGARYYDPAIARFATMDPLCEKYYSISPYVYCANNPVNAIDRDGRVVIFINGMHFGDGGTRDYWDKNGGGFATAIMNQLNDKKALYYDGAMGGARGTLSSIRDQKIFGPHNPINTNADDRYNGGYDDGTAQAQAILKGLDPGETIKIITHSMGAAYAKGFVQALLDNGIDPSLILFEADFAPYQPTQQKANSKVKTYQFSHKNDKVAGYEPMEGAIYQDSYNDPNQGGSIESHRMQSFLNQIQNLPAGNYKVVNGQIVSQ